MVPSISMRAIFIETVMVLFIRQRSVELKKVQQCKYWDAEMDTTVACYFFDICFVQVRFKKKVLRTHRLNMSLFPDVAISSKNIKNVH